LPFDVLFNRWGSDDLFYYTQIAGNVFETGQFSFDGSLLTNGFQVLFELILVPFGGFMHNQPKHAIYVVLILQTVLSFFTVFQFRKLNKTLGFSDRLNLIICGVFFLHPKLISVVFNGTEAALSILVFIFSIRAYFWVKEERNLLFSTLVFGALVLTRLDFSLFLFLLFCAGMLNKHNFWNWFKVSILPIVLFLGWLGINYLYFGSIMPSSGTAKQIIAENMDFNSIRVFFSAISTSLFSESKLSWLLLILVSIGLFQVWKNKSLHGKYALFIIVASIVSGTLIVSTIGYFRDWYLIPQYITMVYFSSLGIDLFMQFRKSWIIPLSCFLIIWTEAHLTQRRFRGSDLLKAANNFPKELHKGKTIGSFNAGLLGCSLGKKGYTIVNLDGVVNNDILPFLKQKKLEIYLRENNIHYILDHISSIDFFLKNYSTDTTYSVVNEDSVSLLTLVKFSNVE
jgi:hypothetical protein